MTHDTRLKMEIEERQRIKKRGDEAMKKRFFALVFVISVLVFLSVGTDLGAATRLKDIAHIDGVRSNQIYGYGLVVGLNSTGDRQGSGYTVQSIGNMLRTFGITIPPDQVATQIRTRNIAAVMVTADLPPFVRSGSRIDIVVSSIGDATSLSGGVLLQTPLLAADGKVYAVAQGQISTGLSAGTRTTDRGPLTVARIPNGALIENEVPSTIVHNGSISVLLHNPDFSTASNVISVINSQLKSDYAKAIDAGTIKVTVPSEYNNNIVQLIATIESLTVIPDAVAKVVINERTGTVVAGKEVRISSVAVTHGNISVQIQSQLGTTVSTVQSRRYPPNGELISNSDTTSVTGEGTRKMLVLDEGVNIYDLVNALNTLGVATKDLIAIIQAIKEAGALHADLEIL